MTRVAGTRCRVRVLPDGRAPPGEPVAKGRTTRPLHPPRTGAHPELGCHPRDPPPAASPRIARAVGRGTRAAVIDPMPRGRRRGRSRPQIADEGTGDAGLAVVAAHHLSVAAHRLRSSGSPNCAMTRTWSRPGAVSSGRSAHVKSTERVCPLPTASRVALRAPPSTSKTVMATLHELGRWSGSVKLATLILTNCSRGTKPIERTNNGGGAHGLLWARPPVSWASILSVLMKRVLPSQEGSRQAPNISFHQTRVQRFWLTPESARVRIVVGTVRPRALAASGLTISSSCLGYSTGSSAAFLPFKILST